MKLSVAHRGLLALGCVALARLACAAEPSAPLERLLRAQRPDVLRWETQALDTGATPATMSEIRLIGRIGARTPVRFADGRVRWYAVAGFRPVLIAAHALERGTELTAADAQLDERDVIGLGCRPVSQLEPGTRWRTARRLASGDAVCASALEVVPDVERDGPVTLSTRRGGVSVSRVLTAATDARAGERVRLRDRTSGAIVIAIVTGPGKAHLSEEPK
jgi:flagella basal body P-ring formation protein FlgA